MTDFLSLAAETIDLWRTPVVMALSMVVLACLYVVAGE